MIIRSRILALIVFIFFFGGIALTSALGWWKDGSGNKPRILTKGKAAGQANPADIRGSYTLSNIEASYGVPSQEIKRAFNIPQETDGDSFTVKNLESIYPEAKAKGIELGATSMRLFVAYYQNLPYTISGDVYLPSSAVAVLKEKVKLTTEQIQYLEDHIYP